MGLRSWGSIWASKAAIRVVARVMLCTALDQGLRGRISSTLIVVGDV
jgi:hypothetical protein